jgi:type IV pilus assembly protein PilX
MSGRYRRGESSLRSQLKRAPRAQRGLVLVSSLLLLLVVTILAVSMFRNFGVEEKIAGNTREKQRALMAAEAAQQYAEWWLAQGNGNLTVPCNSLLSANAGQGAVCTNSLPAMDPTGFNNVANVALPWTIAAKQVGTTYLPIDPMTGAQMVINANGGSATSYYKAPVFYISYLGLTLAGTSSLYQIDAVAYGGNQSAVAIVESTYMLTSGVKDLGAG